MNDESECKTAADVRQALLGRWKPSDYVSINEAPQSSDRSGRKIDVLVISLWRSRGYEIDAIEIKVSVSDWRRELKEAEKADFWWNHSHRFWVAVPAKIVSTVKDELPTGWGLLSCTPDRIVEFVKPEKHKAQPLQWGTCIGLIRASADCGWNALRYAEQKGEQRGREMAQANFERTNGDEALRRQLTELREKVAAFEEASGISLSSTYKGEGLGEVVALVRKLVYNPSGFRQRIERQAQDADTVAKTLRELAGVLA